MGNYSILSTSGLLCIKLRHNERHILGPLFAITSSSQCWPVSNKVDDSGCVFLQIRLEPGHMNKQVHEQWLTFIQLKISTSERVVALPKGHFHSFSITLQELFQVSIGDTDQTYPTFPQQQISVKFTHEHGIRVFLRSPSESHRARKNPVNPSSPIAIVSFASIAIVSLLKVWDRQWRFPSKTSGVVGGYAIFDLLATFHDLPQVLA